MNGRPKVYMGRDGIKGISRIGQARYLEKKAGPKKRFSVYMGGGGVSARTVLANGGIVGGGMVRVRGGAPSPSIATKPKPEKRLEKFSKAMTEKEREFVEADAKAEKPGEAEVRKNMMEMAREPQTNPPTMVAQPEAPKDERGDCEKPKDGMTETEERLADFLAAAQEVVPTAEETRAVLPELPLGETKAEGGKKRRKRKGRKTAESTEVPEAERAAIQAELEAASDAVANEQ